jgi:hypothetical protein
MDSNRFDDLAKGLAHQNSRRSVVKGIGGGAAAAVFGLAGRRGASAAKAAKVGLCHVEGNGSSHYIVVSGNALNAHLAHGDVVTDLTDTGNCGACGNACTAPENATASCTDGACGFSCNDGFELNDAGDACVAVSLCDVGFEAVNGGCFQITGFSGPPCSAACDNGFGNVDGSGNFLCGAVTGTPCGSNADCPSGQACTHCCGAGFCIETC